MTLLDPDILELSRQLSPTVNAVAGLVGLFLWAFGAYSHRFWLALAVTVSAGVTGLYLGGNFGVQPLVSALLMALAAGVLSLALARVTLFVAGGVVAVLLVRVVAPGWNEFVCFLVGGLTGVCLYRLWIMVVSSLVGTILTSYAILGLVDSLAKWDAVAWVGRTGPLLTWGLAGAVLLGVIVQFVLDRKLNPKKSAPTGKARKKKAPDPPQVYAPPPPPPPPPRWWWPGRAA